LGVKPSDSGADHIHVHHRSHRFRLPFLLACACAAVLLTPAVGARQSATSWAQPQIRAVVAHGLMATDVASFQPNAPLTRQELNELLPALPSELLIGSDDSSTDTTTTTTTDPTTTDPTTTDPTTTDPTTTTPGDTPPGSPQGGMPVSVSSFDAALVDRLGLTDAAARFQNAARQAGLTPPKRYGTETVARLLGLRTNHPAWQEKLELLPGDRITRAEAAYSIAQILSFRGGEAQWVEDESLLLAPPTLNSWQKRVLNYAVSMIGYPYIWGGLSPSTQTVFGQRVKGGFDCSGLVWRVYKLRRYSGSGRLSATIRGRTTFTMSGEVPRSKRIAFAALQPGDVLFFGSKGPRSSPAQIGHTAIYLGNGWFIQSSGDGVNVEPLEGWYLKRFAWARRPLAEAGLTNVYSVSSS
jgi:cell wall-associated NlpC family hydrolase